MAEYHKIYLEEELIREGLTFLDWANQEVEGFWRYCHMQASPTLILEWEQSF